MSSTQVGRREENREEGMFLFVPARKKKLPFDILVDSGKKKGGKKRSQTVSQGLGK